MNNYIKTLQKAIDQQIPIFQSISQELDKAIIGQTHLKKRLLISVLTRNHILLEGVPGLAKTTAISTLAKILGVDFRRIQFTPDLLPSDLLGSRIYNQKTSNFSIKKGPIFANFILADEINRSPAKVQSALLEAMQERQVTIADTTFDLPNPFFVMATQNPIEHEGTYPLPEAQVDRFMLKTVIDYPTQTEELEIINLAEEPKKPVIKSIISKNKIIKLQLLSQQIYMDDSIKQYITDIVFASRNSQIKMEKIDNLISYGASPRASIGLMQAAKANAFISGRAYVIPEDIKEIALDILRHRIVPTYEAEAEKITSEKIINKILNSVIVP